MRSAVDPPVRDVPARSALSDGSRSQFTPRMVHCFEFRGVGYGYFVKSGDLVRLSGPARRALSRFDEGGTLEEIERMLAAEFDEARAQSALRDLRALLDAGYLTPEVKLTRDMRERDYQGFLEHQPRNLMFFVTEACNLKCTYCYELEQGVHGSARMLKQVDAERTIDRYLETTTRKEVTITFFGGEPLLNFRVVRDSVLHAERRAREFGKDLGFTMTTNLTLLTEEIAEFLAVHKFHVMVSIDGDEQGNDAHRKTVAGEGTYRTVRANLGLLIDRMRTHGVRLPKLRATLSAQNPDPIAVEQHLLTLGTPLVQIGETHGTVEGGAKAHDMASETALEARARVDEHVAAALAALERDPGSLPPLVPSMAEGLRKIHETLTSTEVHALVRPKLCGVCRNMKAVTPKGDLYPCHRYVGMEAFRVGNMNDGGLDRAKVHDYYERIYSAFEEKCTSCWARHLCGGQCPWYLSRQDGTVSAPDDAGCDLIRAGMESRLGLYALLLERFPDAFRALIGQSATAVRGEQGSEITLDQRCGC